ncbi:hypothetical protein [EBPR siphovirus 1]|nr:hypothetical protein [EBPR siphovirus 1]
MEITPEIQAEIDRQVALKLQDLKGKLDGAFEQRDAANTAKRAAEEALAAAKRDQDAALLRAREEGRTAGEGNASAALARIEALENANRDLARDKVVSAALAGYTFRTASAGEIARELILKGIQQNAEGAWTAKDGKPVTDLVKATLESEEHSFLLKPAVSTGAGATGGKAPDTTKSLLESSNEEILKRYSK